MPDGVLYTVTEGTIFHRDDIIPAHRGKHVASVSCIQHTHSPVTVA